MDSIPFNTPICLQAHTGNNLQNCFSIARCQNKNTDEWEQLNIIKTDDNKVVIQSLLNGNNLQVQPDGRCVFANKNMSLWEKFEVEHNDSRNIVYFISCHTGNVLQCNMFSGIASCCNKNRLLWEEWSIVRLPNVISKVESYRNEIACGSIAGAVTGYSACSAAISSLGFTTGGIAAGSTAAAMMSAEAIAAGGGVAASGTVATLQSIGALGIMGGGGAGLVLFSLSASVGCALGGALAYGVKKLIVKKNLKDKVCTSSGEDVTNIVSPGDIVSLYSTTEKRFIAMWGDYVGAGDLGKTPDSKPSPSEVFTVVDAGGQEIAFHCFAWNRFMRLFGEDVDSKGGEKVETELPPEWESERFTLVDAGGGKHFPL
jgi:hypothetical protein